MSEIKALNRAKRYRQKHPDRVKYWNDKFNPLHIIFKGKIILLKNNPRTNVCSECGKKYPEELKRQTHLHHDKYDSTDPLKYTRELCTSCHIRYHTIGDRNPIWKGGISLNLVEYMKKYKEKNREQINAYHREWVQRKRARNE